MARPGFPRPLELAGAPAALAASVWLFDGEVGGPALEVSDDPRGAQGAGSGGERGCGHHGRPPLTGRADRTVA